MDSAGRFQSKAGAEEESETLLSALTEMLDSVEDDDMTLSPFDTLPDTKLLTHPECGDSSAVGTHTHRHNKGNDISTDSVLHMFIQVQIHISCH